MSKEKVITELTKEQSDLIPVYRDEYRRIATLTGDCDRAKAEAAVKEVLLYQKAPNDFTFLWTDSPTQGARAAAKLTKLPPQATVADALRNYQAVEVTQEDIENVVSQACAGAPEAYWVGYYAYLSEVLKIEHDGFIDKVKEMIKTCGAYWCTVTPDKKQTLVVMCERPVAVHVKNDMLHNTEGYAIEFKDGTGVCMVEGVRYNSFMDIAVKDLASK